MNLAPFQEKGVEFLLSHTRAILGDEMGLGKTAQALTALSRLNKFPALIVAPAALKWSWAEEIEKWGLPLKAQVVHGAKSARISQFSTSADVYIVNYELARIHRDILANMRFSVVILDEAHKVKNRKAKTTKAIQKITRNSKYIWLLTGTPIINRASELYSLLNILDRKRFSSYWRFVGRYCIVFNNGFGWSVADITDENDSRVKELRHVLSEFLLRRTREEVAPQMPPKTITQVFVELSASRRKIYEQMKEKMFANIAPDTSVFAPTVVSQLMRLRQIAIDETLVNPDCDVPLKGAKVDAALEIIQNTGESVVVFSNFSRVIKRFAKNLEELGIPVVIFTGEVSSARRREAVADFMQGKARVFLATLGAGGQGLNLDKATIAVFLDKSYSPALNSQAQDRIYRLSQKHPVTIYEIIAKDTIEEKIEKLLKHKDKVRRVLLEQLPVSKLLTP